MASHRDILEVLLNRVELAEHGGTRRAPTRHLVLVSLVWPRPTIAERTAVKDLALDGTAADLSGKSWTTRVLFKETVQGPLGIKVDVTAPVTESEVAEFLRFLGSSVLDLAGDELAGSIISPFLAGLVRVPARYAGKWITASGKKSLRIVASGHVDIGTEQPGGKDGATVDVALVAPERIARVTRSASHGSVKTRRRTLLKKGDPNGRVLLGLRRYR